MAQDFAAAFNVGEDDKHISTIDADGVALAAIQGLYQMMAERDERVTALETRVFALEKQNASLEARLAQLEQRVGGAGASPTTNSLPWGWLLLSGVLLGAMVWQRRQGGA